MRSQDDTYFSSVCDRVKVGKLLDEDISFLKSRVLPCPSEHNNEAFKSGKLSIIVTTNSKKDSINHQKLEELLPGEKEYYCNSVDHVLNLPGKNTLPSKIRDNAGKTGNLQSTLKLKVGAPVVMTINNSKKKYREDGLVNGSRGYVQAVQVSKSNKEKVDIVWVVFNDPNVGRLYRAEHYHLRDKFNPGHKLATPILPVRKGFNLKFGNVEYQRQNFPLSLSYAITAHKSQGWTLDEVIIDFGSEENIKMKPFIIGGSFYTALTRARNRHSVFLKSFDISYIQVTPKIEEKVETMIKYQPYLFKKIHLTEQVFNFEPGEIKCGYLNINGLLMENHIEYLNADKNLVNLDFLVLAETKLTFEDNWKAIEMKLSNWDVIRRYDSKENKKSMGMMLLSGKNNQYKVIDVIHRTAMRRDVLQIQGIILKLECALTLGFIYCKSTPTVTEAKAIKMVFEDCDSLLGDLNLSHRVKEDVEKLQTICDDSKISILNDITRSISNNQLDYILIKKSLSRCLLPDAYFNFISDHKAITLRIGSEGNQFTNETLEKLTFERESHLRHKKAKKDSMSMPHQKFYDESNCTSMKNCNVNSDEQLLQPRYNLFKRKFLNSDGSTCWLNSCLQLVLMAFDRIDDDSSFTSDLACQILSLKNNKSCTLDPSSFKNTLAAIEDIRIATRLSSLDMEALTENQKKAEIKSIQSTRFNLLEGQQCVRDFFLCLKDNQDICPELFSIFGFQLRHSTTCLSCSRINVVESSQIYLDVPVPSEGSTLSDSIEETLNQSSLVGMICEENCKRTVQVEKRIELFNAEDTRFLIVIVLRADGPPVGFSFSDSMADSSREVFIRYHR